MFLVGPKARALLLALILDTYFVSKIRVGAILEY